MNKKLTKSSVNRKICGVCGGFAEYLGMDPTVVRLIFVLASLLLGCGVLFYIIAAFVMPDGSNPPTTY